MLDRQLIPRKLSEQEQLKLALQMSQYNNLDRLVLCQHDNQLKLYEASVLDIPNEIEDAKITAKILELAIKFSIH